MKIELGKNYRLADGRAWRTYAVDGGGDEPVHGAWQDENGIWHNTQRRSDGSARVCNAVFDLVEVRPRHKRTVWINMYPGGGASLHLSRELADDYGFKRHSCIEHTFDFAEGDGL